MKRFQNVAMPGLLVGALLVVGAVSQAQTVHPNLSLDPSSTTLTAGQNLDITGIVSPGSIAGVPTFTTGVQAVLIYDPTVFDLYKAAGSQTTGFTSTGTFSLETANQPVTFTIANGNHAGTYTGYWYASGYPGTGTTLTQDTAFGTYNLKVKAGAKAGDYNLYYTSAVFTNGELNANGAHNFISKITSNPPDGITTFNGGTITVHVVPGPSSLLVFATGAAPALSMLRRRRRARAAA